MNHAGRVSYYEGAWMSLEDAVARLGDMKARGEHLEVLNDIYQRMLDARQILESAAVSPNLDELVTEPRR